MNSTTKRWCECINGMEKLAGERGKMEKKEREITKKRKSTSCGSAFQITYLKSNHISICLYEKLKNFV